MGRYITSTSEKIKPEGLSKTRQVYQGDLVLSNSMSFGRPYIMAVEGCIHDGWLLIRDTQNQFDPVFLCHMLGTSQMLDQYRMFASGSTVNNLNKELVGNAIVPLPDRDEQVKIGNYLDELDNLITLHQRKCQYRGLYGYLSWEQRKLGELIQPRVRLFTTWYSIMKLSEILFSLVLKRRKLILNGSLISLRERKEILTLIRSNRFR